MQLGNPCTLTYAWLFKGKSLHHMKVTNYNWATPVHRYTDFHSTHGNSEAKLVDLHGAEESTQWPW